MKTLRCITVSHGNAPESGVRRFASMRNALITVLLGCAFLIGVPSARADRTVEVTAVVIHAGSPMRDVPLSFKSDGMVLAHFGVTDSEGRCIVKVAAPDDATRIRVRLPMPLRLTSSSYEAYRAEADRFDHLIKNFTFHPEYWIAAEATATTAAIRIEVDDAAVARARFTINGKAAGEREVLVSGLNTTHLATTVKDGEWRIGGIPLARPYPLYLSSGNYIRRFVVHASKTDVELGRIDLGGPAGTAILRCDLTGLAEGDRVTDPGLPGFTLIPLGDGPIYKGMFRESAAGPVTEVDGSLPRIPAGTYYVAPFCFTGREAQKRLIELVAAGEDLSASGIPKVELVEGQETQITIDAAKVEAAILGWSRGG